jgi:hypothetical protein
MKIIQPSEHERVIRYSRSFEWTDKSGTGFSFDSDSDGLVDSSQFGAIAFDNWKKCCDGTFDVQDMGVEVWQYERTSHAVGECLFCKEHVLLHIFLNTCESCGAKYNLSGQYMARLENKSKDISMLIELRRKKVEPEDECTRVIARADLRL